LAKRVLFAGRLQGPAGMSQTEMSKTEMKETATHVRRAAARPNLDSPRRLWKAVSERDQAMDGAFVYAVRSTGVYCLPSCPARRPGRDQVVFFDAPEAAERGGYRACRRCRPRVQNGDVASLRRVCTIIEAAADLPSLAALAASSGIGRFRLQRLFQRLLGLSPRAYGDAIRLRRLKTHLRKGDDVTTALYEAGYGSSSRLYEQSNTQLGMTPATYRRRGAGVVIGYTIASSRAGRLLVAGTERGVSAVYLGDRDKALETALRKEFPEASIRRNSGQLSSWVRALVKHLAGRQPHLDLPLDVRATTFQRRVWKALQQIPYGETCSYREVARKLGQPRAARAVARACATNPVSVLIPCHRVVREDGGLGGYRWGLERKQALLDAERSGTRKKSEEQNSATPGA
jgi:AraC family transcriptional regulator, regulatory protein of adaptative response / methylated-DNA-[protein]-cysteine methyltransferase